MWAKITINMKNSDTPKRHLSYKATAWACYLGNFVQAIVINLTPILFIPLKDQFNLSYLQLGNLVLINFATQVGVDILLSGAADKYGFRIFAVLGQGLAIAGLGLFAVTPYLFSDVYTGFVISTIVFSGGGGLMEMLLSPIVDSIPTDVKSTAMSVLHSFYAWGQLSVIVFTTLFLFIFGTRSWQIISALWLIVPIFNFVLFSQVPLTSPIHEAKRMRVRDYFQTRFFIVALLAILFGGAAEVSMAQWASAFMEKGLVLPKLSGDLLGVAMFALMLGIGRAIFGKYGAKINLNKVMIYGSLLAIGCYIIIALSPIAWISLLACGICGITVSLLWPGTLVITSEKFPLAGASMFAFLAAGGDVGASIGPWFVSYVTDTAPLLPIAADLAMSLGLTLEQLGLRAGILFGTLLPLGSFICHIWLAKHMSHKAKSPVDSIIPVSTISDGQVSAESEK